MMLRISGMRPLLLRPNSQADMQSVIFIVGIVFVLRLLLQHQNYQAARQSVMFTTLSRLTASVISWRRLVDMQPCDGSIRGIRSFRLATPRRSDCVDLIACVTRVDAGPTSHADNCEDVMCTAHNESHDE